jgi:hypothetical protein
MRRHIQRSLLTIVLLGILGIAIGLAMAFFFEWVERF